VLSAKREVGFDIKWLGLEPMKNLRQLLRQVFMEKELEAFQRHEKTKSDEIVMEDPSFHGGLGHKNMVNLPHAQDS
jgi:hypothetical protein